LAGELSIIADRYAGALFEISREQSAIDNVERGLDRLQLAMKDSADFRRLVTSPVISNVDQRLALNAIFTKIRETDLVRDFVLLLAKNRRLFVLERTIIAYKALVARERGEVEASVVSAVALTGVQRESLIDTLRQKLGKTPKLTASVDENLIGGMVIKVGSQMIDTSLRTKLKNLEIAMREAP